VITRTRLGGSAAGYGLLLGLVGLGGVTGALLLPRLRSRISTDVLVGGASAIHAAVLVAVGQLHSLAPAVPLMFVAGLAQMSVMSSLNIAAQEVLPGWVRGRGLAIFQLTFQLGFAGGAALWGTLATGEGIPTALSIAAVGMLLTTLLALRYRLRAADGVDVRPAYRPEPHLDVDVDPDDGPVMVSVEYQVDPAQADAFSAAARNLRWTRGREGAMHWALFQDTERPELHVETFLVASWTEHQREGARRTVTDQAALDRVAAFHGDRSPPPARYLLGHHFRQRRRSR
jgi:MFS family permease